MADAAESTAAPAVDEPPSRRGRATKGSVDSRTSWRPGTGPAPSSAAHSTREPSRDGPPASAGVHSNLFAEGDTAENFREWSARGRHPSADNGQSRSHSRRVSSVSSVRGVVLTMFDDEIGRLRPEHDRKVARVESLKRQLKEARLTEEREAREQTMNRAERLQRRLKVTSRMQACVRGWLVRKRVVAALDHRTTMNLKHAAQLPDLLRQQLKSLQHGVHDLEFLAEHRLAAAVKLQAWWRAIMGQRIMKVIRLSRVLQLITDRMSRSATVIQAWYKGVTTKLRLRFIIRLRIEETRKLEASIMETALKCIIQIQRGYRSKLARRAMRQRRHLASQARQLHDESESSSTMVEEKVDNHHTSFIDSWRPSAAPGAIAAGFGNAGVVISEPPQHDWELQKIEEVGLVPFYDASSERQVRHQIGGPIALMMQQQLAISTSTNAIADQDPSGAIVDDLDSLQKQLGDSWAIYPNGFTHGFLPGLDKDVWEHGGRAESYRNSLKLRGVRRRNRRSSLTCGPRACTTFALPPPCNSVERGALRQAQKTNSLGGGAADADCADAVSAMFVNAPPQAAPKSNKNWRSARFVRPETCIADEEECSWGFTEVELPPPTYRSKRTPRDELETGQTEQWNTLGAPFLPMELKKQKKCGDVDHERVWSIAHALAEQLPAITAG